MKSKHYRKDVILARIIFGLICIAFVTLVVLIGVWFTRRGEQKETQNSQVESQKTEESQTEPESQPKTEESETPTPPATVTLTYGKVTASSLNFRDKASASGEIITSLPEGTEVQVLETLEGWYKISYDGKEGYVSARYIETYEVTTEATTTEQ